VVTEVSSASKEQSRGVQQISQAVAQMDQVTQSNAANAEENAAASEELSSQAVSLGGTVAALTALVLGGDTSMLKNKSTRLSLAGSRKGHDGGVVAEGSNGGHGPASTGGPGSNLRERILQASKAAHHDVPAGMKPIDERSFKDI
jgi:hypothetical protein